MISHLTPDRREIDWFTIGPAKHRGEFKYWPQVYELWWDKEFPENAGELMTDSAIWSKPPNHLEMDYYCGRRR